MVSTKTEDLQTDSANAAKTRRKRFRPPNDLADNVDLGSIGSKEATRKESSASNPEKKMERVKSWVSFKLPPLSVAPGRRQSIACVTAGTQCEVSVSISSFKP